jgi:homoserine O-acetyltransferase
VQQHQLAAGIPTADQVRVVTSPHGHDAFLVEAGQVAACLAELLPPLAAATGGTAETVR